MNALRTLTVGIPLAFALACTVGDGDLTDIDAVWDVQIVSTDGDCEVSPVFGNRFWSQFENEGDIVDPDDGKVHDHKLRFSSAASLGGTETDFLDCPLDGDAFRCDPMGEGVAEGRLHLTLAGERDGKEHLVGTIDAVGTRAGAFGPTASSSTIWCEGVWSFDATRIVDGEVKTSKVDPSCDQLGAVASGTDLTPATLFVANNSSTRIMAALIDPSGAITTVNTAEPGGMTAFTTTLGAWFVLQNLDDGTCKTLVEVTEIETVAIVHGTQD